MKKITVILAGIVILALICGAGTLVLSPDNRQNCSCCAKQKCHSDAKCHNAVKACCGLYQIQTILSKSGALPVPAFKESFARDLNFAYIYLPVENIFHPPKA